MFHLKVLFSLIWIPVSAIYSTPQINLHYTKWVSESDNSALEHHCLRVPIIDKNGNFYRQMISYCMSEMSSKFHVQKSDFFRKLTFDELSKENINSQDLYIWSAPMDLIEDYQSYLNEISSGNDSLLSKTVFYNCTMPRFGPMCEYQLIYYHENHLSLTEIVSQFYKNYKYNPTSLTCYKHLKCNRGPDPSCLDWSEVCNGKVDCLDSEIDEEHCWQLHLYERQENEYQCLNGQCVPQAFFQDRSDSPDCFDSSDDIGSSFTAYDKCATLEPAFKCEDTICHETPLTNSCVKKRRELLLQALFSIKSDGTSDECWSTLTCLIVPDILTSSICDNLCEGEMCVQLAETTCPDMLYFPSVPVLFGHIYFAYRKNGSQFLNKRFFGYPYVCYNNSLYDAYFLNASKILFNNTMCYYYDDLTPIETFSFSQGLDYWKIFERDLWEYNHLGKTNQTWNFISTICKRSNMYQCANSSKCISKSRLTDSTNDCPHGDDKIRDGRTDYIEYPEDDSDIIIWYADTDHNTGLNVRFARKHISFQIICDGFIDLLPRNINGQNETDETECEQWQCRNSYTRCDGLWNCANGLDETACISYSTLNCSSDHHICYSPNTSRLICLPIKKANDGNIDCLGATDEPTLCSIIYRPLAQRTFHCMDFHSSKCIWSGDLCNGVPDCPNKDDEQFCTKNRTYPERGSPCFEPSLSLNVDAEKFLCDRTNMMEKHRKFYFFLNGMNKSIEDPEENAKKKVSSTSFLVQMPDKDPPRCHRGLNLRVWLNKEKNLTRSTCLCPSSYYGDQCQYQNERVSLTIAFRTLSDSLQILFEIVISLIDDSDQRMIHSYEQFTYLSLRDCQIKSNLYLLYSTRPKDSRKNYSIHIDIYEKVLFTYRGSLVFPVSFPFLPVYRLVLLVNIPRSDDEVQSCLNDPCVHGKCVKHLNTEKNMGFCRCNKGWSGKYCTIEHPCQCSLDSLCTGVAANNRSICICPMNKFGSRCLLHNTVCQTNDNSTCLNGGQCIPDDDYIVSDQKFTCICPKGFSGDQCETVDNALILSFGKEIVLSQSIFVHFIEVVEEHVPVRTTTLRTTQVRKDFVTIYWSRPFHLVFIDLSNKSYYLAVLQTNYERSRRIVKKINPSDRCPDISELFNQTFVQLDLLRRIKYYHLPCQNQSWNLSCFSDDVHLCLCYDFEQKRLANCLKFNHHMKFDCSGKGVCENGGQCFQDDPNCPKRSVCICPQCYYGRRCQFSTSGSGVSLDAILGYHILPDLGLDHQPLIIKMSLGLTIIFILVGVINGVLSLITFKNKAVRNVGCGTYLLGSSIVTLLTMLIFGLKFLILLFAQMSLISNQLFLQVQCHSIDFLLRVCLSMDQWLNACVAVERAVTIMKATHFDKKKSKRAAKFVIILLLIVIIGTCVHDPIYRRLINEGNDDDDVKRTWCIISYRPGLEVYNYVMQTFHFVGPVILNLVSAIILITKKSRQQSTIHTHRTYKEILREQFRQHKHLLTAPVILVILALPRLIITFVSKCMKSTNDSWLFLVGYFISFIPPMLTFVVFIVPSEFYKDEFHKSVRQYRTGIQRRLHLISSR